MAGREVKVLTCSQACSLAWVKHVFRLVPHARTGDPFILGFDGEETLELCSVDVLRDDDRLRELLQKHVDAVNKGGAEAQAFVDREELSIGRLH